MRGSQSKLLAKAFIPVPGAPLLTCLPSGSKEVLVDGEYTMEDTGLPKASSRQGLDSVLLMGSKPSNPVFVLQTGLPYSHKAGLHSLCIFAHLKELAELRCGDMKRLPSGR